MTVAEPRTEERLLDEFEAERPGRKLHGAPDVVVSVLAAGLSLFAIYWVFEPLAAQEYRPTFLAVALLLTFLVFRGTGREDRTARPEENPSAGRLAARAALASPPSATPRSPPTSCSAARRSRRRSTSPRASSRRCSCSRPRAARSAGSCRRSASPSSPTRTSAGSCPSRSAIAHKGYGVDRIVGQTYMGLEGLFGVPLDVAATYIILFTIYGAVLEYSGAARFFVELSYAAFGRSRTGTRAHDHPGRLPARHGVGLGRGDHRDAGLGDLAAAAQGGLPQGRGRRACSPRRASGRSCRRRRSARRPSSSPSSSRSATSRCCSTRSSRASCTTSGSLLAIEADARRFRVRGLDMETPGFWRLLARWGYHFSSLIAIVVLLAIGLSPFRAVLYATVLAFLLSFLDKRDRMGPRKVLDALVAGARGVLPIAATTRRGGHHRGGRLAHRAGAEAVVADRRRGRRLARADRDLQRGGGAGVGLAVPVTASFIIAAVIIAPALISLGVEDFAAYMFIFYYAVLSEVSPPTALSAFAAAAITGGDGFRTMMLLMRYTAPAFLVPFAFVLSPNGEGLLLQGGTEHGAARGRVSAVAVGGLGRRARRLAARTRARCRVRLLFAAGSVILLYLEPLWIAIGLGVLALAVAAHLLLPSAGSFAPGFRRPFGSSARLTARWSSSAAGESWSGQAVGLEAAEAVLARQRAAEAQGEVEELLGRGRRRGRPARRRGRRAGRSSAGCRRRRGPTSTPRGRGARRSRPSRRSPRRAVRAAPRSPRRACRRAGR